MAKGMTLEIEVWDVVRSDVSDSFKTNVKAEGVTTEDDMRIFFMALCSKLHQLGYTEDHLISGVQYTFQQMETIPLEDMDETLQP